MFYQFWLYNCRQQRYVLYQPSTQLTVKLLRPNVVVRDASQLLAVDRTFMWQRNNRLSGLVGTDDIADERSTQRTMATALAAPLLHGALVAHTHVPTHVQYSVYRALVADRTLAACWWRDGRLGPLPHSRRVQR